jgi:hypothetical protein
MRRGSCSRSACRIPDQLWVGQIGLSGKRFDLARRRDEGLFQPAGQLESDTGSGLEPSSGRHSAARDR